MNKDEFLSWLDNYPASLTRAAGSKPLIMGILNVTPDSFSDGALYLNAEKACERALKMIEQGADILDIGGESSKPGAQSVSIEEELARVMPVLDRLTKQTDICISIDTSKPEVMSEAVAGGACMINDIYGLTSLKSLSTAAKLQVPVCIMHMRGRPEMMQDKPEYAEGVIPAIQAFFTERINACLQAGIPKSHIILDPGFGFGKTVQDNLRLLKYMEKWHEFKLPVLLGVSRKSTIGALLNKTVEYRNSGSLAMAVYAMLHGAAIIRTHDVDETVQARTIIHHIRDC